MDDGRDFEIEHWIDAPVGEVYARFTEADKMAAWHGVEVKLDPQPGGIWWVRHENGAVLAGEFVALDPPHSLVFTWGFEAAAEGGGATPAGSSRVEVRLSDDAGRTKIVLRHSGFAMGEPVEAGWRHFLPRLNAVL